VPLVGVGLLYQQGYFRQYLNQAGWQQEAYEFNHFDNLPLTLERDEKGETLTIQVQLPGRGVGADLAGSDWSGAALFIGHQRSSEHTPRGP